MPRVSPVTAVCGRRKQRWQITRSAVTHRRYSAFALYEVLIGVAIFAIGLLALGRSIDNCMSASTLSEADDRVRLILSNRMAEIQVTPGMPDQTKETKVDSGFGIVTLTQKTAPANLKDDEGLELPGIQTVTLTAKWTQRGAQQSRQLEFYVYRAG